MDVLRQQCIFIDDFRNVDHQCAKLFLLSHTHSDHIDVRNFKRWPFPIYCSQLTKTLLTPLLPSSLQLNALPVYQHLTISDIQVFTFPTFHAPGSIGFFFPLWKIVYLGDTRLTPRIKHLLKNWQPTTIIVDGTDATSIRSAPTPLDSFAMFYHVLHEMLRSYPTVYMGFAHTGTVLLCKLLRMKVRLDHSMLPPFVETLLKHYRLVSSSSRIVAVSIKDPRTTLIPSSMFFFHSSDTETNSIVCKDRRNKTRVFVSFHLSRHEYQNLLHMTSNVQLIHQKDTT